MDNYSFTLRNDSPVLNGEKIGAFEAFFPDKDQLSKTVEKENIPKNLINSKLSLVSSFNADQKLVIGLTTPKMGPLSSETPEKSI